MGENLLPLNDWEKFQVDFFSRCFFGEGSLPINDSINDTLTDGAGGKKKGNDYLQTQHFFFSFLGGEGGFLFVTSV